MRQKDVHISVENIGGIDQTEVSFDEGITLLTGRNATNRTSLLRAIMAGLGSKQVSLKGDADSGRVRMQFGGNEYTRTLEPRDGRVHFSGEPYLEDPELADLFAFLLATNEGRRAVALQEDLRDIIMQPVDSAAIRREIDTLQTQKAEIEDEITHLKSLESEVPELEQNRAEIGNEIDTKRETLASKREQLAEERTESSDQRSELDEKMDQLGDIRSKLDTVEFRRDNQRESLEHLRAELDDLEAERDQLPADVTDELDEIETKIARLRETKQKLQTELSTLQSVIQFNEGMLEGTNQAIVEVLGDNTEGAVTDQLLADAQSETVCWTCGTRVPEKQIDKTLGQLREFRQSKFGEQTEIENELQELKDRRSTLQSRQEKHEQVTQDIAEVRSEIEDRESKLEELNRQHEELAEAVASLEEEVEALEAQGESDERELELRSEINQIELEIERLEENRDTVEKKIDDIQAQVDELPSLEERKVNIQEQITELRTRIDRIEREAIERFNEHMENVLDRLEYENLDRIWIERVEEEVQDGRGTTTRDAFRLHVVRSTADGRAYRDEFAHLSESEREVTGLVFVLAGYLAHEVYEVIPFMLLDSLEAIDAQRIAALVEYLGEYADYLVVALLEEDAAALDSSYTRITDI